MFGSFFRGPISPHLISGEGVHFVEISEDICYLFSIPLILLGNGIPPNVVFFPPSVSS